jgi:hypothetical protein
MLWTAPPPPTHHSRDALAVLRADRDEHRRCRRLIPVGFKVRRRRIRRELQTDFDFGIIRGEANATAHEQLSIQIRAQTDQ